MKTKSAKETSNALHNILAKIRGLKVAMYWTLIQSDDGEEFFNEEVKGVLRSFNNIQGYPKLTPPPYLAEMKNVP